MIIASAIKLKDGQIFVGERHGDAIYNAVQILKLNPGIDKLPIDTDGFITSDLKFIEREEALVYAKEHGQYIRDETNTLKYQGPELFSEDLW